MTTPKMMTKSLRRLNLWPSLLSNNITVEICRNTPMTKAIAAAWYFSAITKWLEK